MDILLAVVLFLVTSGTAYLGVHVTLHPPGTDKERDRYKLGFLALTLMAAGLITWQSRIARAAQADLQNQLSSIRQNTERQPNVVVENKIDPNMLTEAIQKRVQAPRSDVVQELLRSKESEIKSLRLSAFMLTTDIQTFASEREKGRPRTFWNGGDLFPRSGESIQQYDARTEKDRKDYAAYEAQTVALFSDRYWNKALGEIVLLKRRGFNTEAVWFQPTTTEQIKDFALGLANVVEKSQSQ